MTLLAEYRDARRDEDVARLRRVIALRAMVATGMSQQQVGDALGISQPAVSQQLRYAPDLEAVRPDELLEAAARVLKALAAEYDYWLLATGGWRCSARSLAARRVRTLTSTFSWMRRRARRRWRSSGSSS